VVDRTFLGTIAEWVSHPTPSRSYCFCSPSGKSLHIKFETLLLSSASTLVEPLQDRPQTASALKIWTRANRLWCNTVTGGLHQPLGKWLVPGPKLRRSWPFYFDPDTNTLWSRTGEGFSVHSGIQISSNSRNT
jgi:hypothetical protein